MYHEEVYTKHGRVHSPTRAYANLDEINNNFSHQWSYRKSWHQKSLLFTWHMLGQWCSLCPKSLTSAPITYSISVAYRLSKRLARCEKMKFGLYVGQRLNSFPFFIIYPKSKLILELCHDRHSYGQKSFRGSQLHPFCMLIKYFWLNYLDVLYSSK